VNYYNEFDPFAAAWLRELIKEGLIPSGEVDERSIIDVDGKDIKEFTQCHFFSGIGGWSYALELAGWPADRPVWTGSPPCQPFSVAGNQKGKDDLRHLWPVFFNLIHQCRPPVVFGEQVASAIRHEWFDDLQADLEEEGYASAMVVLGAHSVNAPHKRDRLFYVAERVGNTECSGFKQRASEGRSEREGRTSDKGRSEVRHNASDGSAVCSMGNSKHNGSHGTEIGRSFTEASNDSEEGQNLSRESQGASRPQESGDIRNKGNSVTVADTDGNGSCEDESKVQGRKTERSRGDSIDNRLDALGNTKQPGLEGWPESGYKEEGWQGEIRPSSPAGFWDSVELAYCRDGKYRPIPTEPALFPLAHGIPNRVGLLRGAGNAIVPQVAAEVIKSYMDYASQESQM